MGVLLERGTRLDRVVRVPYENAFLIGELLTTKVTMLSGEPKAGKSLLAAGMVSALLRGDAEFVGLPVHKQLNHVVFVYTDDGADAEIAERIEGSLAERVTVLRLRADHVEPRAYWQEIADDLCAMQADLLVVDHMLGMLGSDEDIADSTVGAKHITALRQVSEAGVPVLVVTHTPKGMKDGVNLASSPIGSRAVAATARGLIALRKDGKGRRIEASSNRAHAQLVFPVVVMPSSEASEVPVWSRDVTRSVATDDSGPKRKRAARPENSLTEVARVTRLVLDQQPKVKSINALANWAEGQSTLAARTLRSRLTKTLRLDGDVWKAVTDP